MKQDALDNLHAPFFDVGRNMCQFFMPKGLNAKDQIVLLGNILKFLSTMSLLVENARHAPVPMHD